MSIPQWKKNLRPASFRGVPFKIEGHELSAGRRGVQHEYAQREMPYAEDTGRKGRQFTLEGFVIGSDYMKARDALLVACETEGAGELIHPYLGRQVVNCFDVKLRESSRDGGMAIFSFTFVEAGNVEFPSQKDDTSSLLNIAADGGIASAQGNFSDKFSVAGMPGFVADSAIEKINGFADTLAQYSGGGFARSDKLAELAFAVRRLKNNAISLIQTPDQLAAEMAGNMALLRQISNAPRDVYKALQKQFGFGADDPAIPTTTTTRRQQAVNQESLNQLIKVVSILEASKIATEVEYTSTEDAAVFKDELAENLDTQMDAADNDDLFSNLQSVRTKLIAAVPPPDQTLATVAQSELKTTLPSLVVAYDIYENKDFEADLIDRNNVEHPGFVVGGRTLEVLQIE